MKATHGIDHSLRGYARKSRGRGRGKERTGPPCSGTVFPTTHPAYAVRSGVARDGSFFAPGPLHGESRCRAGGCRDAPRRRASVPHPDNPVGGQGNCNRRQGDRSSNAPRQPERRDESRGGLPMEPPVRGAAGIRNHRASPGGGDADLGTVPAEWSVARARTSQASWASLQAAERSPLWVRVFSAILWLLSRSEERRV